MGNIILGFIYYVMVGVGSLIYRIFGINPFQRKGEGGTYWIKRDTGEDNREYRVADNPPQP